MDLAIIFWIYSLWYLDVYPLLYCKLFRFFFFLFWPCNAWSISSPYLFFVSLSVCLPPSHLSSHKSLIILTSNDPTALFWKMNITKLRWILCNNCTILQNFYHATLKNDDLFKLPFSPGKSIVLIIFIMEDCKKDIFLWILLMQEICRIAWFSVISHWTSLNILKLWCNFERI